LVDILLAARTIARYTDGLTLDGYLADDMVQSAVERQIEIMGEAANAVSDDFRSGHPELPMSLRFYGLLCGSDRENAVITSSRRELLLTWSHPLVRSIMRQKPLGRRGPYGREVG
jgi:hypothetical protein